MSYKLSSRSKERISGIHPELIEIIEEAITNSPYDFGVPAYGGLRTIEDQQELYAKGRTEESINKGEKPITFCDGVTKKSNHQAKPDGYGHAFDIYIFDHETKRASWNIDKLTAVADHLKKVAAARGLVLSWGGDWTKFKDYPHFEIA